MIRRLADRLVAIDLFDRAAELLQYQITYRLEGTAQSAVAARLAKIHLLNGAPDRAIDILRLTRRKTLPLDIDRNRRRVEARALIEQRELEAAEAIIEGDDSRAAMRLRNDIYWAGQDWPRVARSSKALLAQRSRDPEPLNDEERLWLLREAVALVFLDRQDLLAGLRREYSRQMAEGPLSGLFGVMTDPEAPPGRRIGELSRSIAGVDQLRTFMDVYREEFADNATTDADERESSR